MANHTDDCPHCNQDRRSVGDRCCPENITENARLLAQFREEQAQSREILETLGIGVWDRPALLFPAEREVIPHPRDIWRFLRECIALRPSSVALRPSSQ